jgi:hypothetical protein
MSADRQSEATHAAVCITKVSHVTQLHSRTNVGDRLPLLLTSSSLPESFLLVAQQWRQQIADDPPLSGFDFRRHGHAGFERRKALFSLDAFFSERDMRDIGSL